MPGHPGLLRHSQYVCSCSSASSCNHHDPHCEEFHRCGTKQRLQCIFAVPPKQPAVIQWIATTIQPIDLFSLGIYYGLFFLTVVLIVTTLPKAIIAWKERG